MPDTVSSKIIFSGRKRHKVHLQSVSDGTGESGIVKVDKSALVGLLGAEPSKLAVEMIEWTVDQMRVDLYWDRGTDVKIATLTGSSFLDFRDKGDGALHDSGSGGTGDIILTTADQVDGASYDIVLHCRLVA